MFRTAFVLSCAAVMLVGCATNPSSTAESPCNQAGRGCVNVVTVLPYDIPSQRLDETAQALAHAQGCNIVFDQKYAGIKVNAVKGKVSIREAMDQALQGTGLMVQNANACMIEVGPVGGAATPVKTSPNVNFGIGIGIGHWF